MHRINLANFIKLLKSDIDERYHEYSPITYDKIDLKDMILGWSIFHYFFLLFKICPSNSLNPYEKNRKTKKWGKIIKAVMSENHEKNF